MSIWQLMNIGLLEIRNPENRGSGIWKIQEERKRNETFPHVYTHCDSQLGHQRYVFIMIYLPIIRPR